MEEPSHDTPAVPEPPRDRPIWVVANLIDNPEPSATIVDASNEPAPLDDFLDPFGATTSHSVETYEGYARWDGNAQDWLDASGMSIRQFYGTRFFMLSWRELSDRVFQCPESETSTTASIYHWESAERRETGRAGFFAVLRVHHDLTNVEISNRFEGPFATRADAAAAIARLLQESIWPAATKA